MLQIAHLIIHNTELLCTRNNVLCLSEAFQENDSTHASFNSTVMLVPVLEMCIYIIVSTIYIYFISFIDAICYINIVLECMPLYFYYCYLLFFQDFCYRQTPHNVNTFYTLH